MIILRKKIRVKSNHSVPITIGNRICRKCNVIKSLSNYYVYNNFYNTRCLACVETQQAAYNAGKGVVTRKKRYQKAYKANPQKFIQATLKFIRNNPDYSRRKSSERLAMRLQRMPKWLNDAQKDEIKRLYKKATYLTKKYGFKYEVDHIIPLNGKNVSGLHVPWNLRILTKSENVRKSNKVDKKYY